jgi:hypothetical protein
LVRSPLASANDTNASRRSLMGRGKANPTLLSGQSRSGVVALMRRLLVMPRPSTLHGASLITCLTHVYHVTRFSLVILPSTRMGALRWWPESFERRTS